MPSAIRLNMFSDRLRTEAQPRTKNGAPAQSATGAASRNWTQIDNCGETN